MTIPYVMFERRNTNLRYAIVGFWASIHSLIFVKTKRLRQWYALCEYTWQKETPKSKQFSYFPRDTRNSFDLMQISTCHFPKCVPAMSLVRRRKIDHVGTASRTPHFWNLWIAGCRACQFSLTRDMLVPSEYNTTN